MTDKFDGVNVADTPQTINAIEEVLWLEHVEPNEFRKKVDNRVKSRDIVGIQIDGHGVKAILFIILGVEVAYNDNGIDVLAQMIINR